MTFRKCYSGTTINPPKKNRSSYHGIKWSFHGMIPSFHAVFGLRQRDKSAKVIDYKDCDYLLVSFGDEDCCRMYSRISAVSSG